MRRMLLPRPGPASGRGDVDLGRFGLLLAAGIALPIVAPRVSDFWLILTRDGPHRPVEWLPPVRGAWTALNEIASDPEVLAGLTAVVAALGAVVTLTTVHRLGGRADLLVGPSLLLIGQNLDSWVGPFVAASCAGSAAAAVAAGAIKVIPGAGLPALLSLRWRRVLPAVGAGALLIGLPFLVEPSWLLDPLEFASDRSDPGTTIWALLAGSDAHLTWQPLLLTAVALVAISLSAARGRIREADAVALSVLAATMLNKIWQPHYILWLMPALAMTTVDRRAVRALEVASLLVFLVLWTDLRTPGWQVGVGAVRFAAAGVVAWSLWRASADHMRSCQRPSGTSPIGRR